MPNKPKGMTARSKHIVALAKWSALERGLTPMYRYSDRNTAGEVAPKNATERVWLDAIEVSKPDRNGWCIANGKRVNQEFIEPYSDTLAGARQKFLKLKLDELRKCQREAELILMSIDQMLVVQPGE